MTRVKVKICGITRPEDATSAAESGADAIGLIFYEQSPRNIRIDQAINIVSVLPPFITRVGLFVNAEEHLIKEVMDNVSLDVLQFHGNESPATCRSFSKPYIKAVRMNKDVELSKFTQDYQDAAALLLDTHVEGLIGGTGQVFDWTQIPDGLKLPIILAGGLTAGNVIDAIRLVRPYAVDVSGGVESEKGIKDHKKIAEFIKQVNSA